MKRKKGGSSEQFSKKVRSRLLKFFRGGGLRTPLGEEKTGGGERGGGITGPDKRIKKFHRWEKLLPQFGAPGKRGSIKNLIKKGARSQGRLATEEGRGGDTPTRSGEYGQKTAKEGVEDPSSPGRKRGVNHCKRKMVKSKITIKEGTRGGGK